MTEQDRAQGLVERGWVCGEVHDRTGQGSGPSGAGLGVCEMTRPNGVRPLTCRLLSGLVEVV